MTGFYATGADRQPFNPSVLNCPHFLQIWIETTFGYIMGMAYVMAGHRLFPAYVTHL
jgi:hypothetical protein